MEPATEKAATLIEALSYIQRFRDKVVVVKMGGSFFDDEAARRSVLTDLVFMWAVGIHPVLVHGGGPAISRAMKDAKLQPKWASGLRFTDAVTLSIVQDVLINTINKQLVEQVRELGGLVEPIHPRNRPVLRAVQKFGADDQGEPVDLGYVGDVVDVDLWILSRLVQEDVIPVIAPLGLGADGQVYNVNADTAAAKVAVAMHAEKLVNMSDTHGIRTRADDAASTVESLSAAQIEKLIADGRITGGMIPKVECCLTAVRGGVKKSHIIDGRIKHSLLLEIYTDQGVGTEIVA
jgi:acetylglutamate kinase